MMNTGTASENHQADFQSWGRYPRLRSNSVCLNWRSDFPVTGTIQTPLLPVGMGRSYGDCCLLAGGTLLVTRKMDRLLDFDPETGLLKCEAGATLENILEFSVPRGWFLPVTPGTKYVTVGGAIANDIHGKNHHVAGTFGCHVRSFELARSNGKRMVCSPYENAEWYRATIGGLGLTGLITWAEIRLRPIVSRRIDYKGIQFHGIDEFLAISRASANVEYTVAWIDCVSQGRHFARGIFMQGNHSALPGQLEATRSRHLSVPFDLPAQVLSRHTVKAFNALYFHKQRSRETYASLDYEQFFYPLDSVLHWNRIYGKEGLLQFQCMLPLKAGNLDGITKILEAIKNSGLGSFLAVLKVFGDIPSPGMLSFPRPGITLALDFPVRGDETFRLFDYLSAVTLEHGGRIYPAKDARMTELQYKSFYPEWRKFSEYIDEEFSSTFWQRVTKHA